MTHAETVTILRQFNEWRRGGDIDQPGPLAVGIAIDAAIEMIDRLEAAESDALEQARLNGMGGEREAALLAKLEAAEKERDALRAKIEQMERQEPVASVWRCDNGHIHGSCEHALPMGAELYALPGAQPAQSVPDGWKEGVEAASRLIDQKAELYAIRFGIDDVGGLSFGQGPHAEIKMDHYTSMIELADEVRAMLAAAPEAQP